MIESDEQARVENDTTVRLGLRAVGGGRVEAIRQMIATRKGWRFSSVCDFLHRTDFTPDEQRVLSGSGTMNALAGHRREALWQVTETHKDDELCRYATENVPAPAPLPKMTLMERVQADFTHLVRDRLPGIARADGPAIIATKDTG